MERECRQNQCRADDRRGSYCAAEMLSPQRRWKWLRGPPLSSAVTCVRKGLWSRHHYLWILLILLVVCVAIQTFVAHQASDRLPGLPPLRFPTLQNMWAGVHSPSSPAVNQDTLLLHTETTAALRPDNEGYGVLSDGLWRNVDKSINLPTSFQAKNVAPGKWIYSKHRSKAATGLAGSPALLTAGMDKGFSNTSTPSRFLKAYINSVQTKVTCHPKSHIVFLKTHKTASSTILNILYRYGESRNLTFALPLKKHSQLFYPYPFASYFVEGVTSRRVREFHIICNHMRFRKSEVMKVMPKDSLYFSILRHPVAMMESIFVYYKSIPAFHNARSLDDFLNNSWINYNASVAGNHYARNILAFDFGFENNVEADAKDFEERTSRSIAAIEQDFHLILISEYFDESMILLKHALCWSLEDVVSFKLNTRSEQSRHSLSPTTAEKIKRWNSLDWRIYLHFNATFWHKVDSLVGQEQMKRELEQLRELQSKLINICLNDGGAVDPSQIKDTGLKPFQYGAAVIQGYNLKPHIDRQTKAKCQRLITPELQYTDQLYTQQFPELSAKLKQAVKASPQHQRSNRTGMKGGEHHRQFTRHRLANLNNQKYDLNRRFEK